MTDHQATSRAERLRKSGKEMLDAGDSAGAAAALEESVAVQPGNAWAWLNLSRACRSLNRPARAMEAIERAGELKPNSLPILLEEVDQLHLWERPQDAVAALERFSLNKDLEPGQLKSILRRARELNSVPVILECTKRLLRLEPDKTTIRARFRGLMEFREYREAMALAAGYPDFLSEDELQSAVQLLELASGDPLTSWKESRERIRFTSSADRVNLSNWLWELGERDHSIRALALASEEAPKRRDLTNRLETRREADRILSGGISLGKFSTAEGLTSTVLLLTTAWQPGEAIRLSRSRRLLNKLVVDAGLRPVIVPLLPAPWDQERTDQWLTIQVDGTEVDFLLPQETIVDVLPSLLRTNIQALIGLSELHKPVAIISTDIGSLMLLSQWSSRAARLVCPSGLGLDSESAWSGLVPAGQLTAFVKSLEPFITATEQSQLLAKLMGLRNLLELPADPQRPHPRLPS